MQKVIVLGSGMVGSAIAGDLSFNYDVSVLDINKDSLENLKRKYSVKTLHEDISKLKSFKSLLKSFNLVICAVPGFMGFQTLKKIIEAEKNVVDISFFAQDPFELDELAKQKNISAIVDCGVAPGLSNLILGYHNSKMKVESFECMVGGLPFKRELPFQYKAPFSPIDVIEEYTRPARIVENGRIVIKEALSELELININPIGTLESFNTDGLRTLLKTMKIPNMKEKTLRFPGHVDRIKFLIQCGFFSENPIEINNIKIEPISLASKILFDLWKLDKNEKEFTIMQIKIQSVSEIYVYTLFDEFDEKTNTTSMARTTGYTCSAAARLLLEGEFKKKGIIPPEFLGSDEKCFNSILNNLKERNVKVHKLKEKRKK